MSHHPAKAVPVPFWVDSAWYGGLLVVVVLALAATWLEQQPFLKGSGLSALTLAIVLGMFFGNTPAAPLLRHVAAGVDFSRTRLLRLGIILYGFRITLAQLYEVGWAGLLLDALMLSGTFLFAQWLGQRVLRMDRETSLLIGAGASICGAAAVMGAEPVVRAPAHKVSVAVATVVVFGTIAMFLYPFLQGWLGMGDHAHGLYVGSTVHEVAQVVVAGNAAGEQAAATAVIEKMLRVMMLAPFLLVLGAWLAKNRDEGEGAAHQGKNKLVIPWFALWFIAVCCFNSLGWLPKALQAALIQFDTFILAAAMGALGLRTHVGAVREAGAKPLLLASGLFVFLVVGGYVANRVVLTLLM